MSDIEKPVAVVGGGLVGCMQAIFLANRGFKVELYESRPDILKWNTGQGQSINFTLCHGGRSIAALNTIGCEEEVVLMCVPLYG